MPRVTLLLTGCFVVLLAGCGSSSSTVSGTITFDGKPLNSGFVLFQPSQGTVQSANIQPDGTYTVGQLGLGIAKISITVPPPPSRVPDGVSADPPEAFDLKSVFIPRKYGDVATSGLTYEVKPGSQTHDIQLQQ
jgi:hypothetical protein